MSNWDVTKKNDGFFVVFLEDGRCDYLNFFEGLRWRFARKLPQRVTGWATKGPTT